MRPRSSMLRRPGTTLVEMIMFLLVLAIAAGVVVPMLGHTDDTRLVEAAKLLEADLAVAQMESIAHGDSPRQVYFNLANEWYEIRDASGTPITDPLRKRPYRVTFGTGRASELADVTIVSVKVGAANVTSLPFGVYGQLAGSISTPQTNAAANATITLGCGNRTVVLTVENVTGDVSISQLH